ncbi:hypothetical protein QBC47DRAFT_394577 [Echria macrotheca]|uniref:Uncharacterized protein n=1 Tax=Echria macrotheca TaxID=438768 RepID=A0AAJ0F0F9_9PEZI|nr:hypothetical protein QBC47DRAFT_394577 [Echria macrotheca]
MKLSSITTALLAAAAIVDARSTPPLGSGSAVKTFWKRLTFREPLNWYPDPKAGKSVVKSFSADDSAWSAEDWAANILLKCKDNKNCISCLAFQSPDKNNGELSWFGILFGDRSTEQDFIRKTEVTGSIGYTARSGGSSGSEKPLGTEIDEEVVLNL